MIDISLVVERFLLYAGLEQADGKITSLCQSSKNRMESLIKSTAEDNDDRLIVAAASDAFYQWSLLKKAVDEESFSSLRAGDITVKNDSDSVIKAAEKIRDEAFKALEGLIDDRGFYFGEVSIDDLEKNL